MAHSRAPHPLAEAICSLAVPPLAPSILRIQATHNHFASLAVVLHIRPPAAGVGLEIAVHTGLANDEEGFTANLGLEGHVYAVPPTAAGVAKFAAELIAGVAGEIDDNDGDLIKLMLPRDGCRVGWNWVKLDLFPAGEVLGARRLQGQEEGRDVFRLELPHHFHRPYRSLAAAVVENVAAPYAQQQWNLQLALSAAQREGKEPPAHLPDSDEERRRRYCELRQGVMDGLLAALTTMLQQACRYRGTTVFPGVADPNPAADENATSDDD